MSCARMNERLGGRGEVEESNVRIALVDCEKSARQHGGFAGMRELNELRKAILIQGMGNEMEQKGESHLSMRARAWKQLLGVGPVSKKMYLELVERGQHPKWGLKIGNDTFRTFKNCASFEKKVSQAKLVRVLNAFVHAGEEKQYIYVQGMNVLCGMMLYVMPELDAFYCFLALVTKYLSSYVRKNLDGVYVGCELVGACLRQLDSELADFIENKLDAEPRVYAFANVLTLNACCPPIDEIVLLWDIYFAAGLHLNIVFFVSQLILMRDEILAADSPNAPAVQCLRGRDFPIIDAQRLLQVAFPLLLKLDSAFVQKLVDHMQSSATSNSFIDQTGEMK